MQLQEELQIRRQKGAQIAKEGMVFLRSHKWVVPSQNTTKKYEVKPLIDKQTCSCLDYQLRERKYKHMNELGIKADFQAQIPQGI